MKKYIAYRSLYFSFFILATVPSCIHRKNVDKQYLYIKPTTTINSPENSSSPPITIWIHGTIFFKKSPNYYLYHKNPHLIKAGLLPKESHLRQIADIIHNEDKNAFPLEHFYMFYWSGHFSIRERKAAAEKLHHSITDLIKEYHKEYGIYPIIRIIAHSHGGNLALHMAQIKSDESAPIVDTLVLLACPVQHKTMHLIDAPMFKRIYSLYSSFDLVQVLAPQLHTPAIIKKKGRHRYKIPTFSSRLFPEHSHVIQTKIKVNNIPVSHTYFSHAEFASMLPHILKKLTSWGQYNTENSIATKYKLLCIYNRANKKNYL